MLGSALALIWHPVLAFAFPWPSVSLAFAEFDSIHPIDVAGISRGLSLLQLCKWILPANPIYHESIPC